MSAEDETAGKTFGRAGEKQKRRRCRTYFKQVEGARRKKTGLDSMNETFGHTLFPLRHEVNVKSWLL